MADVGILGGAAVRGNPDGMASVAHMLRQTAEEIHTVRGTLERSGMHGIWQGAASDAFRSLLQNTPSDLSKAARSYELAADTVTNYASRLRHARDTAQALANQLDGANRRIGAADNAVRTTRAALTTAQRTYYATHDPAQRSRAYQVLLDRQRAVANADRERAAAGAQADQIRRQAHDNRVALDNAAAWAQDRMHEASVAGIRNSASSYYNRHIAPGLATAGHVTLEVLKAVGDTLYKAATLPFAVIAYINNPSWENLSELLDHVSAALTVAVVVLTIAAIVFSGGAFAAAVPAIVAGLKMTTVAVDSAKLGVDTYRKVGLHDESVSYTSLAFQAVGVGIGAAGAKSSLNTVTHKMDGWMNGIEVQPKKWDQYAMKAILVNEAKPASNTKLNVLLANEVVNPEGVALKMAEDHVERRLEPNTDKSPKDWEVLTQNFVQSSTTVIKHQVKNIQIRPIVPMPIMPITIPQVAR